MMCWASSAAETSEERENPWLLLEKSLPDVDGVPVVPAVLDFNTAEYSLHKGKIGAQLEVNDARGAKEHSVSILVDAAYFTARSERALQYAAAAVVDQHPAFARGLAELAVERVSSPAAWLLVGKSAMAMGDARGAIAAFSQAAFLHPRMFAAQYDLALAYDLAGESAEARRHADRARSLRPTDPRVDALPR